MYRASPFPQNYHTVLFTCRKEDRWRTRKEEAKNSRKKQWAISRRQRIEAQLRRRNLGPTETIYQGENRLRSQLEDLCMYEMESGKVGLMYLIANQSSIDDKMLLRKAGYTGGAYRGQYEGKMLDTFSVIEMVLYWGEEKWESDSTFREFFEERRIPEKKWKYIDEMKLHVFQMRYLPEETRKQFQSDMRIIVDFLAAGDSYRSDREVVHKAALIKMIKVLSGDMDIDEIEVWMEEQGIREEDEVKMCELFNQYERKGRVEGRAEGEKFGIIKGKIDDILDFLRECGEIPRALQETISKEQSIEVLKRWLKIATKVKSIEEFQNAM